MDFLNLFIQIASGATGGAVAGSLWRNISLGTFGNALAGLIGGAVGGQMINFALDLGLRPGAAPIDPGTIISEMAGSGVAGSVAMFVIGHLRRFFAT